MQATWRSLSTPSSPTSTRWSPANRSAPCRFLPSLQVVKPMIHGSWQLRPSGAKEGAHGHKPCRSMHADYRHIYICISTLELEMCRWTQMGQTVRWLSQARPSTLTRVHHKAPLVAAAPPHRRPGLHFCFQEGLEPSVSTQGDEVLVSSFADVCRDDEAASCLCNSLICVYQLKAVFSSSLIRSTAECNSCCKQL